MLVVHGLGILLATGLCCGILFGVCQGCCQAARAPVAQVEELGMVDRSDEEDDEGGHEAEVRVDMGAAGRYHHHLRGEVQKAKAGRRKAEATAEETASLYPAGRPSRPTKPGRLALDD